MKNIFFPCFPVSNYTYKMERKRLPLPGKPALLQLPLICSINLQTLFWTHLLEAKYNIRLNEWGFSKEYWKVNMGNFRFFVFCRREKYWLSVPKIAMQVLPKKTFLTVLQCSHFFLPFISLNYLCKYFTMRNETRTKFLAPHYVYFSSSSSSK